jgi:transposase-like protein
MNDATKVPATSVSPGEQKVYAEKFDDSIQCPWCESDNNQVVSPFGGTVSEVLFRCQDCEAVFGWMKWDGRLPD